MALPFRYTQEVFASGTATTTTTVINTNASISAGSMIIQVDTTGFSGTIDIQGRVRPSGAWKNLMYVVSGAGSATPAVAQISYTTDTAVYHYGVINPLPYMRVVMTRSAGSVGAWAETFSEPLPFPFALATVPSASSGAASSQYTPVTSVVTAAAVKASAGNVLHFLVTNANASARWFQLHNKATIPLATEVPIHSFIIPGGSATQPGYVEFTYSYGAPFATGIGVAVSTTQGTFTDAATASDHTVHLEYI